MTTVEFFRDNYAPVREETTATDLEVTITEGRLELAISGDPEELELEVFAARERRGLLERSLELEVDVVVRQA